MTNKEKLEKINKFTRRKFAEDELYTFSVILCDNDIDHDLESFSDKALDTLKDCFVGKTGVFDHNASTVNQNARIYDTEVICDNSRKTKDCRPYRYLKANAYMVRTAENKNLIAEIDSGIKKEVSISCAAARKICSVCGCDKNKDGCNHVKGRSYSDRPCYTILDNITDAYEWSFVAQLPDKTDGGGINMDNRHSSESIQNAPELTVGKAIQVIKEEITSRQKAVQGAKQAYDDLVLILRGVINEGDEL